MKKRKSFKIMLSTIGLTLLISSFSYADNIDVYLKNKKMNMPVNPVIENSRTLVPMRAIFEGVGADVNWDQKVRTVTAKRNGTTIKLPVGKKFAFVNGRRVALDVPAKIINGSTLVPTRFVTESLGIKTDWDSATRSVLLESEAPYGNYRVTKVIDGDTIKIIYNGKEEVVKMTGVGHHQNIGKNTKEDRMALDFTKNKLEGKIIGIEFDEQKRDEEGRLLGYIYNNGKMYNKVFLEEGYGQFEGNPYNKKYGKDFAMIQQKSQYNKKGFWGPKYNKGVNNPYKPQRPVSPGKPNPGKPAKPNPGQQINPHKPGVSKDGMYVGSMYSKTYHFRSCPSARSLTYADKIGFRTKVEASNMGYVACKVCRP